MINFDAVVKEVLLVHNTVGDSGIKREILGPCLNDEDLDVVNLLKRYHDAFLYSPLAKLSDFIELRNSYLHESEPSPAMSRLLTLTSQILVADVSILFRYFRKAEKDINASLANGEYEENLMDRHLTNCAMGMNEKSGEQFRCVFGQPIRNFGCDQDIELGNASSLAYEDDDSYVSLSLEEYAQEEQDEQDEDDEDNEI